MECERRLGGPYRGPSRLDRLPRDLMYQVAAHLDLRSLLRLRKTCKTWSGALGKQGLLRIKTIQLRDRMVWIVRRALAIRKVERHLADCSWHEQVGEDLPVLMFEKVARQAFKERRDHTEQQLREILDFSHDVYRLMVPIQLLAAVEVRSGGSLRPALASPRTLTPYVPHRGIPRPGCTWAGPPV